MSTNQTKKDEILAKFADLSKEITCKSMMGEFLLYADGVHIGGIYDGRVLIKETKSNQEYNLDRVLPYDSAKRTMYHLKDINNNQKVNEVILNAYQDLKPKK